MNIINNAQWYPSVEDKILYFTNEGPITYDCFCVNNHRFCSLSMESGSAANRYDLQINVTSISSLQFGYYMRAITMECAYLEVTFTDEENRLIDICRKDITDRIHCEFQDVIREFIIPEDAVYAKFALRFCGKTTACTFGMPLIIVDA